MAAVLKNERPEKPVDAGALCSSHAHLGVGAVVLERVEFGSANRPAAAGYLSSAFTTWVPAPVYPAGVTDDSDTPDSDSSGYLGVSLSSCTGEV